MTLLCHATVVIKFLGLVLTIAIEPHAMDLDIDLEAPQVALQPAGAFFCPLSGKFG